LTSITNCYDYILIFLDRSIIGCPVAHTLPILPTKQWREPIRRTVRIEARYKPDGTILWAADMEKELGISLDNVSGNNIFNLIPSQYHNAVRVLITRVVKIKTPAPEIIKPALSETANG